MKKIIHYCISISLLMPQYGLSIVDDTFIFDDTKELINLDTPVYEDELVDLIGQDYFYLIDTKDDEPLELAMSQAHAIIWAACILLLHSLVGKACDSLEEDKNREEDQEQWEKEYEQREKHHQEEMSKNK